MFGMDLHACIGLSLLFVLSGCKTPDNPTPDTSDVALLYLDEFWATEFNTQYRTTKYTSSDPVIIGTNDYGTLGIFYIRHISSWAHGSITLERDGKIIAEGRLRSGRNRWFETSLKQGDIIRLYAPPPMPEFY